MLNSPLKKSVVSAPWAVLCDFDGTISVEDATDVLLERFGQPGWQVLEENWRSGRISSRQCMQGQIGLLDVSKEELDEQIDEFRIDPDFPAFVRAVQRMGWNVSIVSDGLDYSIHRILAQYGMDDLAVYANHLVQTGPRSWRLDSPCAATCCRIDSGTCKCACAQREQSAQINRQRVLLIGDGASDFCAAENADYVFAKHRLIEHCRTHNIHHVPIVGFADAINMLPALMDKPTKFPQPLYSALE